MAIRRRLLACSASTSLFDVYRSKCFYNKPRIFSLLCLTILFVCAAAPTCERRRWVKGLAPGTLPLQLHCCWHFRSLYQLLTYKHLVTSCQPDCASGTNSLFFFLFLRYHLLPFLIIYRSMTTVRYNFQLDIILFPIL